MPYHAHMGRLGVVGMVLLTAWGTTAAETVQPWQGVATPVTTPLYAVTATPGGGFVAVGEGGVVLTSHDGRQWTRQHTPTVAALRGVAAGDAALVAVGDGGVVLTNRDGEGWQLRASGATGRLNAVTWTGGRFVAVGASGSEYLTGLVLVSEDGQLWRDRTPADVRPLYGVAGQGGRVLAVGWTGQIVESMDGEQFASSSLGEVMQQCWFMLRPSFLYGVAATAERWVTVGLVVGDQYPGAGVALTHRPPEPWRCTVTQLPPLEFQFRAVAAAGASFVAVGVGGIAESPDGLSWRPQWAAAAPLLHAVAIGPRCWVAVGDGGSILRRDAPPRHPWRRVVRPPVAPGP